jgi:sulfur-carrier protein adenylyltransferase/sulfurtransferase
VDFDAVDVTNLQRQILYGTAGRRPPEARRRARPAARAEPRVRLELHGEALGVAMPCALVAAYDVVLDGTDNFPARYLVNDACVLAGRPNAYGSIFRFEGQASVFAAPGGPCYRCLHPEPPPPGLVPSCAEGGVLGVLPGIIGTIQATEAIKLMLGIGEPLIGRFLIYDALRMRFRELTLRKDPECPVCGSHPTIRELRELEAYCTPARGHDEESMTGDDMTVLELKARMDRGDAPILIDCREPHEYDICRIPGAQLIPMREIPAAWASSTLQPKSSSTAGPARGVRRSWASCAARLHERAQSRRRRAGLDRPGGPVPAEILTRPATAPPLSKERFTAEERR